MVASPIKPVLKYPGAKWNIAPWIISHFPPHVHYVEPFFGSGAVFFNKPPAKHEVINDLSGDVVNLFRVIRERGEELAAQIEMTPWSRAEYLASYLPTDDPLERARRLVIRVWQGHNSDGLNKPAGWRNHGFHGKSSTVAGWLKVPERLKPAIARLKHAEIEQCTALDLIARCATPSALLYVDPPYVHSTRAETSFYQHEMADVSEADVASDLWQAITKLWISQGGDPKQKNHIASWYNHWLLLDALDAHPGPVVLSGYHCPLYDDRLSHWQTVEKRVQAEKGNTRTEVLWLNKHAQPMQARMF